MRKDGLRGLERKGWIIIWRCQSLNTREERVGGQGGEKYSEASDEDMDIVRCDRVAVDGDIGIRQRIVAHDVLNKRKKSTIVT